MTGRNTCDTRRLISDNRTNPAACPNLIFDGNQPTPPPQTAAVSRFPPSKCIISFQSIRPITCTPGRNFV